MWGGATFDVSMRFLKEDPWQRLHALSEAIPNVLFQMLLRGSNAVGYTNYPDNVVQRFVEEAAAAGIDVFRVFDSLNWTQGMTVAMDAVRKTGKICEAAICYTGDISDPTPQQVPALLLRRLAKELEKMGAHILAIKDMAGLLKPYGRLQAGEGAQGGDRHPGPPAHPRHLRQRRRAAADGLPGRGRHRRRGALLHLRAHLAAEPERAGGDPQGDRAGPAGERGGLQQLANYWETVRDYYAPFESGLKSGTAEVYHHEIPGGQYSNYKPQVAGLGLIERWEECKEMYHKVNLLFGDLVKVTPSSKVVGDMAMFLVKNNLEPEDVFTPGDDSPSRNRWSASSRG